VKGIINYNLIIIILTIIITQDKVYGAVIMTQQKALAQMQEVLKAL